MSERRKRRKKASSFILVHFQPLTVFASITELYREFWAFQTPFSRPQKFANPETFPAFQTAVNAVLPQLADATKRERELMGSKALNGTSAAVAAGTKRKREESPEKERAERKEYFFAKFLTSPDLLDLEVTAAIPFPAHC